MRFITLFAVLAALLGLAVGYTTRELQCTQPNEKYDCGSACQTTCATLNEQCPIVNIRCNDACYCIDGYARNNEGTCIPQNQC